VRRGVQKKMGVRKDGGEMHNVEGGDGDGRAMDIEHRMKGSMREGKY
jgi:hypothetical protein